MSRRRAASPGVFVIAGIGLLAMLASVVVAPATGLELSLSGNDAPTIEDPPVDRLFPASQDAASYRASYSGWLRIERAGTYRFDVQPEHGTALRIGDVEAVGALRLRPGRYPLRLDYEIVGAAPAPLTLRWARDLPRSEAVPASVVEPPSSPAWRSTTSHGLRSLAYTAWGVAVVWALSLVLGQERARRLGFACAAVLLAVTGLALMLEVGFRVAGIRPAELVPADVLLSPWWVRYPGPGETLSYVGWLPLNVKEFETQVTFNASGWRDRDHRPRDPGEYRIVVIGDSYVEAKEVPLEDTFHKRLERSLAARCRERGGKLNVLALGRGGSGTVDHLRWLRREVAALQPDLMVLSFFPGNDVLESSEELAARYDRWIQEIYVPSVVAPKLRIRERALLLERSWVNQWLVERLLVLRANYPSWVDETLTPEMLIPTTAGVYAAGEYDDDWKAAWDVTLNAVEHLAPRRPLELHRSPGGRGAAWRGARGPDRARVCGGARSLTGVPRDRRVRT